MELYPLTFVFDRSDERVRILEGLLCGKRAFAHAKNCSSHDAPTNDFCSGKADTASDTDLSANPPAIKPASCYVFAPSKKLTDADISSLDLCSNSVIFAGSYEDTAQQFLHDHGISFFAYSDDNAFVTENAWLTAEGALAVLITKTKCALLGLKTLVVGYGRCGQAMAHVLKSNHADVTVATTSKFDAASQFFKVAKTGEWQLEAYDVVINTAPARIFCEADYPALSQTRLYIELASAPYGIDLKTASEYGINLTLEPALPARYSPEAAAKLMLSYIGSKLFLE